MDSRLQELKVSLIHEVLVALADSLLVLTFLVDVVAVVVWVRTERSAVEKEGATF